ncbi:MAG TPA: HAMP domain-containing sensor histidine kinase [Myxococcota bacterium]|nr:HAMP domain-containing sensor histidine kinase [Myxococcota bacterium]
MSTVRNRRFLWIMPAVAILFASAVSIWTGMENQRVHRDFDRVYEAHVESVARLIWESTRGAARALDALYALSEETLALTARLIARVDIEDPGERKRLLSGGIRAWLIGETWKELSGDWGPVVEDGRAGFKQEMKNADESEIVEGGGANRYGLYCSRFSVSRKTVIVCRDAEELAGLRRETGLGPLLRQVVGKGVVYAVIQDEKGMLASSPGAEVSSFEQDAELGGVLAGDRRGMTFRTINSPAEPLFEGLGPFPLPDGTTALLRVGVDASPMLAVQASIEWRHRVLYLVVGLLVLISLAGTWILDRWAIRKREAERMLAAREEESHHWQTISQMAQTVAHEVRNPLNTIKMAAQRLQREFSIPDSEQADYQELVGMLQSESDRVNHVVSEFMELGKPLVLEIESLPLLEIVEQALMPLRVRAGQEGKRIEAGVAAGKKVRLDRRRFTQIVSNLVGNALDAVGAGGTVLVQADVDADGLHLEIIDDGPGMDTGTLERVQKPFMTTKARGTGLGLSIARRLIEAHQGRFGLSSEMGKGTRSRVFFPMKPEVQSGG